MYNKINIAKIIFVSIKKKENKLIITHKITNISTITQDKKINRSIRLNIN